MILMFGITFAGMAYSKHLKHECQMEMLKALQDPKLIDEICN